MSLILVPLAHGASGQVSHGESQAIAQSPPSNQAPERLPNVLTVGIGGTPPFLIHDQDSEQETHYQGIVLDLWKHIAQTNRWDYELVLQTNTRDALDAVAAGELDVLIGPFGVTAERLERVNFTQPFFVSSVGVILPQQSPTLWSHIRPFLTTAALSSLGGLLICLFGVGNAIWLVERKHNPDQFSQAYLPGIGDGMWFALVTLTTVGYGDRAPSTSAGRFIASIWMLISLIAVSSLIGGLASAFTVALANVPGPGINAPEDLQGTRIAVVIGTTGEAWAVEYQAKVLEQPSLKEAIALVLDGKADGAVFDRPVLEYYLWQNPDLELRLADFTLSSENFGFVVPYDSPLTKPLDLTIVRLREDGTLEAISDRWLQGIKTPRGKFN